jgi:hypothetical protein
LKKALYNLHDEQAVFEDVWKYASSKLGPVNFTHSTRGHGGLCPGRMSESVFGKLLDSMLKPKEKKVMFKEAHCGAEEGIEDDHEDHRPYSLGTIAQILCEKTQSELQEDSDEELRLEMKRRLRNGMSRLNTISSHCRAARSTC